MPEQTSRPGVFISATSADLRSYRQMIKETLDCDCWNRRDVGSDGLFADSKGIAHVELPVRQKIASQFPLNSKNNYTTFSIR